MSSIQRLTATPITLFERYQLLQQTFIETALYPSDSYRFQDLITDLLLFQKDLTWEVYI